MRHLLAAGRYPWAQDHGQGARRHGQTRARGGQGAFPVPWVLGDSGAEIAMAGRVTGHAGLLPVRWPIRAALGSREAGGTVALTSAQLSILIEGIDWRTPERTWRPAALSSTILSPSG